MGRNGYQELIITGEKRDNVEARLRVTSNGVDDANAKQLASETEVKADKVGTSLQLEIKYPEPGNQRAFLTLLVPTRLAVRVDQSAGGQRTMIGNVASLEATVRGDTTVKNTAGRVNIAHRAGRVTIEQAGAVKLTGRGSDATVSNVRGEASFSMQSGELNATLIRGAVDVECQNTEVTFKRLDDASGTVRVNAVGGSVTLEGLRRDARVDGRNTEIDIEIVKAAPIAVYNEGDEPIQITAPPGGFVLDAVTKEGRLTLPDEVAKAVSADGQDANHTERAAMRASGAVRGGGPTITLRASHGDIIVRSSTDAESSQR